jgi:tryptophanyl-tRNA synthetase
VLAHASSTGACCPPDTHTLQQLTAPRLPARPQEEIAAEVADMRWGTFKPLLADALVAHLEPIQSK